MAGIFDGRTSGIILHPTSLPGPFGSGDLGREAHLFAQHLARGAQTWWQMLPVGPPGHGGSPYDSPSAFAGSPWLVPLEELVQDGLLDDSALTAPRALARALHTRHHESARFRESRLRAAFAASQARSTTRRKLANFVARESGWLDDYALFSALKRAHGGRAWTKWETELRDHQPRALERARHELAQEIAFHCFVQYRFDRAWRALREHCKSLGLLLLGDVPIYVAHDGADAWAHQELFYLQRTGEKSVQAGVPPDYFSRSGQLWGNPLYRWSRLRRSGFTWWLDRFAHNLVRFDALRLDHFIAFRRYWEISAHATTAQHGRFVRGPGEQLFAAVKAHLGALPFVAEDLGLVTPEVTALRERLGLPGMRVLQFAFGEEPNEHLPHRFVRNSVVYTGTHDNDTILGWLRSRLPRRRAARELSRARERALRYAGSDGKEPHWDFIRLALSSVANTALVPLQDVLGLGSRARFNTPGTVTGNWQWRVSHEQLHPAAFDRLASLCHDYERVSHRG
jgi:4-alpha-glucanotransferase